MMDTKYVERKPNEEERYRTRMNILKPRMRDTETQDEGHQLGTMDTGWG